ncbi:MAG: zinc-ribbon domain-containing protein, partial [Caulobacteraceae bacterium]
MILACPNCATGYFVADELFSPGGRKVRCAACGTTWRALPPRVAPSAPSAGAKSSGSIVSKRYRERASLRRRLREAMVGGARVGGAALVALLAVGAGIVWRNGVVAAVPASAGLYASLGLPVNPVGVVIENVRAEPTLQDGHAALAVRGILKSVSDRGMRAPPLR